MNASLRHLALITIIPNHLMWGLTFNRRIRKVNVFRCGFFISSLIFVMCKKKIVRDLLKRALD